MRKAKNLSARRERRVVKDHDELIRKTAGTLQAVPDRHITRVGHPTGKYETGKDGVEREIIDDREVELPLPEPTRAEQLAELCEIYGGSYKIKGGSIPAETTRIEFTFGIPARSAQPTDADDVEVDDTVDEDDEDGDKIVGRGTTHQEAIDDLSRRLKAYKAALGDDEKPAKKGGK